VEVFKEKVPLLPHIQVEVKVILLQQVLFKDLMLEMLQEHLIIIKVVEVVLEVEVVMHQHLMVV
tara:strand:- start:191 stop:382 length:192 start_codon:yes stop_codon:yes gene_type:complete